MMPRFFKDMPKPKAGKWLAVVIRFTEFREREVWWLECKGLRRAYLAARFAALLEDLSAPSGVGIRWGVREIK